VRRANVLLDFKSGKNHDMIQDYVVQLELIRRAWRENFPNVPIEGCWIWKGRDFANNPSYWLGELEAKSRYLKNVDPIIQIAYNEFEHIDNAPYKTEIAGDFELALDFDDSKIPSIRTLTLREAVESYENSFGESLKLSERRDRQVENEVALMLQDSMVEKVIIDESILNEDAD
jgi:hypothetical protein